MATKRLAADSPTGSSPEGNLPMNESKKWKPNAQKMSHERRPATAEIAGHFYESKLMALLFLRLKNAGCKFQLGSNINDIGHFDDLALRYCDNDSLDENKLKFIFAQLKHRNDPTSERITLEQIKSDCKTTFGVHNNFENYLWLRLKFSSPGNTEFFQEKFEKLNIEIVLLTTTQHHSKYNPDIQTPNWLLKTNGDGKVFQVTETVVKELCENVDKNLVKKIQENENKTADGKFCENLAEHFLKSFKIYCNQAKEDDVEKIIEQIINDRNAHLLFLIFHDLVQQYWMKKGKVDFLTENDDLLADARKIMKEKSLLVNITNICSNTAHNYKLEFSDVAENSSNLAELNPDRRIVNLRSATPKLTFIKIVTCLKKKLGESLAIVDCKLAGVFYQNCVEEFLKPNSFKHLVILLSNQTECKNIADFASQVECSDKWMVVISDKDFSKKISSFKPGLIKTPDETGLNDLTEECQKIILENPVTFQGKDVKLKDLLGENSEDNHIITGSILLRIIQGDTINFVPIHEKQISYYVERTLKRCNIIYKIEYNEDFLIVEDDQQIALNQKDLVIISDTSSKYEKICYHFPTRNVHWLKKCSNYYLWQKSSNNLDKIRDLLKLNDESLSIGDLSDRVLIIAAEPGMGKSTLLTEFMLKKESDDFKWIIRMNLREFVKLIFEMRINKLKMAKTFLYEVYKESRKNENGYQSCDDVKQLEKDFFERCYSNGRIVLLIDGFDEIVPSNKDCVLELLNALNQKDLVVVSDTSSKYEKKFNRFPNLNVHWLKKCSKNLEKIRSLLKFNEASLSISDLLDRVLIITADPGMGKSTFLTEPMLQGGLNLIIRMNLREFESQFKQMEMINSEIAKSFLFEVFTKSRKDENGYQSCEDVKQLEKQLYERCYSNKTIILLIDGFDEIVPSNKDCVLKLLNAYKNSSVRQMIITTRNNNANTLLENHLKVFALKLQLFTGLNVLEFLRKKWESTLSRELWNEERFEKFVIFFFEEFTHSNLSDDHWKDKYFHDQDLKRKLTLFEYKASKLIEESSHASFLCNPLHIEMIASCIQNSFVEFNKTGNSSLFDNLKINLNLYTLYKNFIKQKYCIYLGQKNPIPENFIKDNELEKKYKKEHMRLALLTIFNKDIVDCLLEGKKSKLTKYIKNIQAGKDKKGFVTNVINGKPQFIHLTFAEFFAAEAIWEAIKSCSIDRFKKIVKVVLVKELLINDRWQINHFLQNMFLDDKDSVVENSEQKGAILRTKLLSLILTDKEQSEIKRESTLLLGLAERFLVNSPKIEDLSDEDRWQLFKISAMFGYSKHVSILMDGMTDELVKNNLDEWKETPLFLALENGHDNIAMMIFEKLKFIDTLLDSRNVTFLRGLLYEFRFNFITNIINMGISSLSKPKREGSLPLIEALATYTFEGCPQELFEALIKVTDSKVFNEYHYAPQLCKYLYCYDFSFIEKVIEKGFHLQQSCMWHYLVNQGFYNVEGWKIDFSGGNLNMSVFDPAWIEKILFLCKNGIGFPQALLESVKGIYAVYKGLNIKQHADMIWTKLILKAIVTIRKVEEIEISVGRYFEEPKIHFKINNRTKIQENAILEEKDITKLIESCKNGPLCKNTLEAFVDSNYLFQIPEDLKIVLSEITENERFEHLLVVLITCDWKIIQSEKQFTYIFSTLRKLLDYLTSMHEKWKNLICAIDTNTVSEILTEISSNELKTIINCFDKKIGSSLHYAIFKNKINAANLFLEKGANPNVRTESKNLQLKKITEEMKFVLERAETCPIHIAAALGRLNFIRLLLERGVGVNAQTYWTKCTPLHLAACEGHTDVVEYLLERGRKQFRDDYGYKGTTLELAQLYKRTEVVKMLSGAVNSRLELRKNLLQNFSNMDQSIMIGYFASSFHHGSGWTVNFDDSDFYMSVFNSAWIDEMHSMCENGIGFLQESLEEANGIYAVLQALVIKQNTGTNWTKLFLKAIATNEKCKHIEITVIDIIGETKIILKIDDDHEFELTDILEADDQSKLIETCVNGLLCKESLVALLNQIYPVGIANGLPSLLSEIIVNRNIDSFLDVLIHLNLERIPSIEQLRNLISNLSGLLQIMKPLHKSWKNLISAIKNAKNPDITDGSNSKFQKSMINCFDKKYGSPLHYAIFKDNFSIADLLLENGAYPEVKTESINLQSEKFTVEVNKIIKYDKISPIHIAAALGSLDLLGLLLDHGANIDAPTRLNYTPLHLAACEGHKEFVACLQKNYADKNIENYKGQTPLALAENSYDRSNQEVINLLTEGVESESDS